MLYLHLLQLVPWVGYVSLNLILHKGRNQENKNEEGEQSQKLSDLDTDVVNVNNNG